MGRATRRVRGIAVVLGALLAAGLLLPYALTPVYRYPPPTPFLGASWYNPYAGMRGSWHKAALHSHGLGCCFAGPERRSDEEMAAYYRSLGYDVPLVSDHMRLSFVPGPRIYEHGANIRKTHQLVIGARRVDWLDFPLLQSANDKQYMLDRLRQGGAVVVGLAHPEIRDGYTLADLRQLTGYDFVEVLHEGFSYEPWWDAALSAGRLAWGTGSDDAHGTARPAKIGLSWTMLRAPSTSPSDVVQALRAGHGYAVAGARGVSDIALRDVSVRGDTLLVTTDPGATSFTFVGQGGRVRAVVRASSHAAYLLRPDDHYIRTVVRTPRTILMLNPVVRTGSGRPSVALARPALGAMWAGRLTVLLTLSGLMWALLRRSAARRDARVAARARRRRRRRRIAA